MRITTLFIILYFFLISSYAQTEPKKGMIYDKENTMYYRFSNDDKYLYLDFYKDEYVQKITTLGGIKVFFNLEGKIDTVGTPKIVYPVYQYPKKEYEEIETMGFNGVPEGKMSVYNEYGFVGESKVTETVSKGIYAKDRAVFEGRISVPIIRLRTEGNKLISIMVLLRGMHLKKAPVAANMGVAINADPEERSFSTHIYNWTWSWIDYELK